MLDFACVRGSVPTQDLAHERSHGSCSGDAAVEGFDGDAGAPGEYVVEVEKDDITIMGSQDAIIDATGIEYGIMVGEDEPITADGCPPITVHGFKLQGLTIRNAANTGIRLSGVDGFQLTHSSYLDNDKYGPFPVCSSNGVISHNFASGHNDAAIYVGDDTNIVVSHNVATDSVVAAEIENSVDCEVSHNSFFGNTGGLLVFVGPGLPMPFNERVLVSHNEIYDNNRANTGSGAVAGVPVGTWKRDLTGKGNSDKATVMTAVRALGFTPETQDEADALAILNHVAGGT